MDQNENDMARYGIKDSWQCDCVLIKMKVIWSVGISKKKKKKESNLFLSFCLADQAYMWIQVYQVFDACFLSLICIWYMFPSSHV